MFLCCGLAEISGSESSQINFSPKIARNDDGKHVSKNSQTVDGAYCSASVAKELHRLLELKITINNMVQN